MGVVTGTILLRNARQPALAVQVGALADTRSVHLCIPEKIRERLQLEPVAEREAALADGTKKTVPYVGPVELRFKNRVCFVGALVIGDKVLLGSIPMEDMDLIVIPRSRRLDIQKPGQ
jgi:clan AA aspartic protease